MTVPGSAGISPVLQKRMPALLAQCHLHARFDELDIQPPQTLTSAMCGQLCTQFNPGQSQHRQPTPAGIDQRSGGLSPLLGTTWHVLTFGLAQRYQQEIALPQNVQQGCENHFLHQSISLIDVAAVWGAKPAMTVQKRYLSKLCITLVPTLRWQVDDTCPAGNNTVSTSQPAVGCESSDAPRTLADPRCNVPVEMQLC